MLENYLASLSCLVNKTSESIYIFSKDNYIYKNGLIVGHLHLISDIGISIDILEEEDMALFISVSNNIRYDHFIRLIDANLSLLGQKNIPTIIYDNFFIYEGKDLFTIPEITIEFEGFYFATSINIQNSNYLDCNYSEAINNCFKNEFFYKVVDKTVDQMNEQEKALVSMYYS